MKTKGTKNSNSPRLNIDPANGQENNRRIQTIISTEIIMFTCGHGNKTTLSYSNKSRLTMKLSGRQMKWSLERLQRRQITPNSAEMIREYVSLTSKAPRASPWSLYRKSNQQTKSNIIPRQVSCNTQASKINILYEDLKRQFSKILQNSTSNETSHKTQSWQRPQCSQIQNTNQLTE